MHTENGCEGSELEPSHQQLVVARIVVLVAWAEETCSRRQLQVAMGTLTPWTSNVLCPVWYACQAARSVIASLDHDAMIMYLRARNSSSRGPVG